jgi:thioredoxin-related protein
MSKVHYAGAAASLLLACLAAACPASAADQTLPWRDDWASAQTAARQSRRNVFVYVYQHYRPTCVEMERTTFTAPAVVKLLKERFELMAVASNSTRSRNFLDRYHLGSQLIDEGDYEVGITACPAYLLLSPDGREYVRAFGYQPPQGFLVLLEQMQQIAKLRDRLAAEPEDAAACAALGHLYLALEQPKEGQPLLEAAVRLDPENRLGVRQEAELDLAVLSIPSEPEAAYRRLVAYRFASPDSPRALEVQYYMAVAQVAGQHYKEAEGILLDFAAIPALLPDGKTPNPVYRSQWCEQADLLLKELQRLSARPAGQ